MLLLLLLVNLFRVISFPKPVYTPKFLWSSSPSFFSLLFLLLHAYDVMNGVFSSAQVGFGMVAGASAIFSWVTDMLTPYGVLVALFILFGFGVGGVTPMINVAAQNAVNSEEMATTTAWLYLHVDWVVQLD